MIMGLCRAKSTGIPNNRDEIAIVRVMIRRLDTTEPARFCVCHRGEEILTAWHDWQTKLAAEEQQSGVAETRRVPLSGPRERMMCPRCGNRRVNLIFEPPPVAERLRAPAPANWLAPLRAKDTATSPCAASRAKGVHVRPADFEAEPVRSSPSDRAPQP